LEEIARTDHWPEIKSPLYKKVIGARRPAPTGPAGELTALLRPPAGFESGEEREKRGREREAIGWATGRASSL